MKCDACRSEATWVASIPRLTKAKREAPAARFRLCDTDADELRRNDPHARFLPLGESA